MLWLNFSFPSSTFRPSTPVLLPTRMPGSASYVSGPSIQYMSPSWRLFILSLLCLSSFPISPSSLIPGRASNEIYTNTESRCPYQQPPHPLLSRGAGYQVLCLVSKAPRTSVSSIKIFSSSLDFSALFLHTFHQIWKPIINRITRSSIGNIRIIVNKGPRMGRPSTQPA
jgi:hypothetical protein